MDHAGYSEESTKSLSPGGLEPTIFFNRRIYSMEYPAAQTCQPVSPSSEYSCDAKTISIVSCSHSTVSNLLALPSRQHTITVAKHIENTYISAVWRLGLCGRQLHTAGGPQSGGRAVWQFFGRSTMFRHRHARSHTLQSRNAHHSNSIV